MTQGKGDGLSCPSPKSVRFLFFLNTFLPNFTLPTPKTSTRACFRGLGHPFLSGHHHHPSMHTSHHLPTPKRAQVLAFGTFLSSSDDHPTPKRALRSFSGLPSLSGYHHNHLTPKRAQALVFRLPFSGRHHHPSKPTSHHDHSHRHHPSIPTSHPTPKRAQLLVFGVTTSFWLPPPFDTHQPSVGEVWFQTDSNSVWPYSGSN